MPNESNIESADKIPPILTSWGVQADVVKAMIAVLEAPNPSLEKLADAIVEHEVIHTSHRDVIDTLRLYLTQHHHVAFENGGSSQLYENLVKQRAWLGTYNNSPPTKFLTRIPRSVREEVQNRYGRREE